MLLRQTGGHATMLEPAPEWQTVRWFNGDKALALADLRGRVVVLQPFKGSARPVWHMDCRKPSASSKRSPVSP